MAANYASNGPISRPIAIVGVSADVNLNGYMFSYTIGPFFTPEAEPSPLTLPPLFSAGS